VVQFRADQYGEQVSINGQLFTLAGNVEQYPVDVESPPFRTQGVQARQDNRKINKYVIDSWQKGIGHNRFRRAKGEDVGGFHDSDALTIHHSGIYPGILHESQTHTDQLDHLVRYVAFKGDYWGLFEQDFSSTVIEALLVAKFGGTSDNWTGGGLPERISTATAAASGGSSLTASLAATTAATCIIAVVAHDAGTVTGVTWNGNAMTDNGTAGAIDIFSIIGSDTGTHDVVATFSSSAPMNLLAIAYKGVGAVSNFASAVDDDTANVSDDVTTAAAGSLIVTGVVSTDDAVSFTHTLPSGAHTELVDVVGTGSSAFAYSVSELRGETDLGTTIRHVSSHIHSDLDMASLSLDPIGGLVTFNDAVAEGIRGFDMIVHKGSLRVVASQGSTETAYSVFSSTDGDTWTESDGTGWPSTAYLSTTVTRRNNFDDDGARQLDFGNTWMVAIYEDPASSGGSISQIRIVYSVNAGSNWTAGAVIPSGSGPKAFIVARDELTVGNPATPILITAEGIYRVDAGGTTFDLLLPLDGDPNNGRWASLGMDGAIWCPLGSGPILHYDIVGQNARLIEFIEPQEGLVTGRQGYAHMLSTPSLPFVLVAYGGQAASKTGSVFAIGYTPEFDESTGKRQWPWHSMYSEANANIDLHAVGYSTEDDATPRLHFALEHASSDEMFHLELPFTDPSSGQTTMKFQADSFIDLPEEDFGDPHADTAVLRAVADVAGDISSADTGQYVPLEYGVNGAAWNDNAEAESTFIGNFVSNDKILFVGKTRQNESGETETGTPVGISAKTWRTRLHLKRDSTNTNFAQIREFQLEGVNALLDLLGWRIPIDLEATAIDQNTDVETIRTRIDTIRKSIVSVAFLWGSSSGASTTYYVAAVPTGGASLNGIEPNALGIGGTAQRTSKGGVELLVLEERIQTN
jgi:hypothetical protein